MQRLEALWACLNTHVQAAAALFTFNSHLYLDFLSLWETKTDNLVNVSLAKVTSAGRWRIQGQLRNQSFPNTIKCLISSSGNVFPQLLVSCHFVCNRKEVHCFVNQQLTLTEFMPVHYKVGEVIYICVCSQDRGWYCEKSQILSDYMKRMWGGAAAAGML